MEDLVVGGQQRRNGMLPDQVFADPLRAVVGHFPAARRIIEQRIGCLCHCRLRIRLGIYGRILRRDDMHLLAQ